MNAVFELKTVNPNCLVEIDVRTPRELFDLIDAEG